MVLATLDAKRPGVVMPIEHSGWLVLGPPLNITSITADRTAVRINGKPVLKPSYRTPDTDWFPIRACSGATIPIQWLRPRDPGNRHNCSNITFPAYCAFCGQNRSLVAEWSGQLHQPNPNTKLVPYTRGSNQSVAVLIDGQSAPSGRMFFAQYYDGQRLH